VLTDSLRISRGTHVTARQPKAYDSEDFREKRAKVYPCVKGEAREKCRPWENPPSSSASRGNCSDSARRSDLA